MIRIKAQWTRTLFGFSLLRTRGEGVRKLLRPGDGSDTPILVDNRRMELSCAQASTQPKKLAGQSGGGAAAGDAWWRVAEGVHTRTLLCLSGLSSYA